MAHSVLSLAGQRAVEWARPPPSFLLRPAVLAFLCGPPRWFRYFSTRENEAPSSEADLSSQDGSLQMDSVLFPLRWLVLCLSICLPSAALGAIDESWIVVRSAINAGLRAVYSLRQVGVHQLQEQQRVGRLQGSQPMKDLQLTYCDQSAAYTVGAIYESSSFCSVLRVCRSLFFAIARTGRNVPPLSTFGLRRPGSLLKALTPFQHCLESAGEGRPRLVMKWTVRGTYADKRPGRLRRSTLGGETLL